MHASGCSGTLRNRGGARFPDSGPNFSGVFEAVLGKDASKWGRRTRTARGKNEGHEKEERKQVRKGKRKAGEDEERRARRKIEEQSANGAQFSDIWNEQRNISLPSPVVDLENNSVFLTVLGPLSKVSSFVGDKTGPIWTAMLMNVAG